MGASVISFVLSDFRTDAWEGVSGDVYKRQVSYLPHFLSAVIVCGMIRTLTSVDGGLVNAIVTAFGGEAIPFLGQPEMCIRDRH